MLNLSKSDVVSTPFPHVMSDALLDESIYGKLRADYPDASIFGEQMAMTGKSGSRTGSGFDIYRGDAAYDRLVADSAAWRDFDGFINSEAFIEKFLELFGDYLDDLKCNAEISPANYQPDLIEGREVLTAEANLSDRIDAVKRRVFGRGGKNANQPLFTRLDIHKATTGYAKAVHCDRPNRLCSLIVYFCDADKAGFEGGELTIHAHKSQKPMDKYERHPQPEDAPIVATVRPQENRGIFFPCCNNSYHGVTAMSSNGAERDYLYINISGDGRSLW